MTPPQLFRALLLRAKGASALLSVLGGLVGLVSGVSAFISAGDAKRDACDAKRDALVLAMSASRNQETYLAFRASLLADALVDIAELDPELRKSKELNEVLAGLLSMKAIPESNKRQYSAETLDAMECSQSNVRKFSQGLRGEQIVRESLTSLGWEEIFKRAEALRTAASQATKRQ